MDTTNDKKNDYVNNIDESDFEKNNNNRKYVATVKIDK